ncbi:hypothetical protein RI367_005575 [Sorochytrium milnesiophthora]
MFMPKESRKQIYAHLFSEGVMVVKKDTHLPRHQDIDVPNLHVMKALQSLESRGHVKSQFSWQYYYYFLTDKGIEYLREFLHLPAEIVPATFKKAVSRAPGTRPARPAEGERRPRGDREEYRKKETPAGDYKPEFRGVGRGARPTADQQ